jgi:hypothetical protein
MYQDAVMVPMGDWRHARLKNLSATDRARDNSRVESGFGKNVSNWVGREMAYPTNVLHLPTECGNRNHSAAFPVALPGWFIRLFTRPGDCVLDPFVGSGTTAVAAKRLGRDFVGIDLQSSYIRDACDRLAKEAASEDKVAASGAREYGSEAAHPRNPPVGMVLRRTNRTARGSSGAKVGRLPRANPGFEGPPLSSV